MTDYEQWKRANDNGRSWKIKVLQGLGHFVADEERGE